MKELNRKGIEMAREKLSGYLLPDCLKPEFDGMSLWEITERTIWAYVKSTETITCACDDPSCNTWGEPGEVAGHIEDCPCALCHRVMGQV